MSQYLIIKKNGVKLGEWCRSTAFYQALSEFAPYGEETEFDPVHTFAVAKDIVEDTIQAYEKSIKKNNKLLEGNLTLEERWETICAIDETEEEIERQNCVKHDINFLLYTVYDADKYTEGEKQKWTWYID